MGERRGMKALELWCKKMTEGYPGVKVENMTSSWRDGLAFCAIIHHFRPDLIEFEKLNKDDIYYNNQLAFTIAEQYLGIPPLLEAEDMVEFPVPDRLCILTYLSQFYRAFVRTQGSPAIVAPKRPASTPERESSTSPTSSSPPPVKVSVKPSGGVSRRDPCAKCSLPVFIAERLNVGKHLYHRTCFRCARCNSQLTLANYYETETENQFCCEICPDEEKTEDVKKELVVNRSLSDEEKSAELGNQLKDKLEDTKTEEVFVSPTKSAFDRARNFFIQGQIEQQDISEDESDMPPSLPDSKPPDLPLTKPPDLIEAIMSSETQGHNENIPEDLRIKTNSIVNSAQSDNEVECRDMATLDSNVYNTSDSTTNQQVSTGDKPEDNNVTKESEKVLAVGSNNAVDDIKTDSPDLTVDSVILESNINDRSNVLDLETSKEDSVIILNDTLDSDIADAIKDVSPEKVDNKKIENESIEIIDLTEDSPKNIANVEEELQQENKSTETIDLKEIPKVSIENKEEDEEEYPDDLNPFSDDEGTEDNKNKNKSENVVKRDSLNPFEDDEEEEENGDKKEVVEVKAVEETPKPMARKKIKADLNISTDFSAQRHLIISTPQEEDTRRKISAPRISLNPFWSDDEEPVEEEEKVQKPVPTPRLSKHAAAVTPEPKPRKSSLLLNSSGAFGSNSSLSSTTSTNTFGRKKKPAPKPPAPSIQSENFDSAGSLTSSPNTSLPQTPKSAQKFRKVKKAPLPPNQTSLPYLKKTEGHSCSLAQETAIDGNNVNEENIEQQKVEKDEVNRNRQSQTMANDEYNFSNQDKSTYGKWKRKKGPAPARPVPQRRSIKSLPILEIKRELDVIELQQQGLEKQGVRLEQIIRDRCEGPNAEQQESQDPIEVEDLILQLFEVVNEKNELCRRQAELMYLQRQQRLEEEHAEIEYQVRCLMMKPEAYKTDYDKAKEEELISRLIQIVERRNEIIECLEMDRVREAEEDDSINSHLNIYASKREENSHSNTKQQQKSQKTKKKNKKEKKFKLKHKHDADKDIDECESSSSTSVMSPVKEKEKKKKKFNLF